MSDDSFTDKLLLNKIVIGFSLISRVFFINAYQAVMLLSNCQ